METRSQRATLNVKISTSEINSINNILNPLKNLKSLSINDLLVEINGKKFNSIILNAIFKTLTLEEGPKTQTYKDPGNNQDMTIGVGLDIQPPDHNDAKAVLLSVNPQWDFEDMQRNEQRPVPSLISDQIRQIFILTLVGARYEKNGEKPVIFKGEIPALIERLNKSAPGLANLPFKPHELVCLVSMAFNTPGLIGPQFCEALLHYNETNDPMDVILQIMECSNELYNKEDGLAKPATNGLQNRRMMEAALFFGNPEALHISYRQFKRIEAALATLDQTVVPINGHPIYSLPYGENERTFHGADNLIRKELIGKKGNLPVAVYYYGSKKGDPITVKENEMDGVVFSGDADTTIKVKPNREWSYPYLAGGSGSNRYEISSNAGHVLINDLSGRGKITVDDKHTLQGIALATDDSGKNYQLDANGKKFSLKQTELSDKTNQLNITWGDDQNNITIPNFKSGQLTLVLAQPSAEMNMSSFFPFPKYIPATGNYATLSIIPFGDAGRKWLSLQIVNSTGEIIQKFPLASLPADSSSSKEKNTTSFNISPNAITMLDQERFVAVWEVHESVTYNENPTETKTITKYSIHAALCSQNGLINFFGISFPDGNSECKLTTTSIFDEETGKTYTQQSGCKLSGMPQIFNKGDGFAILYIAINTDNGKEQTILMCQASGTKLTTIIETTYEHGVDFSPALAALPNGNFAIAVERRNRELSYSTLMTYIINQAGIIVNNFSHDTILGNFVISLSSVGLGFMLAIRDENSLRARIFNGEAWGDEVRHTSVSDSRAPWVVSHALKNNYTLIAFHALNNKKEMICEAMLIDPDNQMIGNAITFLSEYSGRGIPIPATIELTKQQDAVLTFALIEGPSVLFKSYTLQTAALPQVKVLQSNLQQSLISAEEQKAASSDKAFNNQLVLFKPKKENNDTDEIINDFVLVDKDSSKENDEKPSNCLIM